MPTFLMPASLGEAEPMLEGLGALLTARGWERAAIVYGLTRNDGRGRPRSDNPPNRGISMAEFARRGYTGLRHQDAVRFHRQQIEGAIERGLMAEPVLGQPVDLPDEDYPVIVAPSGATPNTGSRATPSSIGRQMAADPALAAAAVAAAPPAAVAARVASDPAAAAAVAGDHDAGLAISRARLDRRPAERLARFRQMNEDTTRGMAAAVADATTATERNGYVHHQAHLDALGARTPLRAAVRSIERNPDLTPGQRAELDVVLDELEHLLLLLRGGSAAWGADDLAFLADMGIEV